MNIYWTTHAWEDYLYWQEKNKKVLKRINQLIKDIQRNGTSGLGKPEPLKFDLAGKWSRRINENHRLVYQLNNKEIVIYQCKYHY